MNLVTKSGTNTLRGQVYEWFRGASARREELLRQDQQPPEAGLRRQPVRRRGRRPDQVEPDVLLRQRRSQPVPGPVPEHRDRADGEDAHGRLLGTARARPAVPDLQPVHDAAEPDARRGASSAIRFPGNIIPPGMIAPAAQKILDYFPLPNQAGHGRRPAELSESRPRWRSRPTTPPPDASITTSRRGTACTAGSAGTSGKRRRTTGSTTSPPAFSSTARTAFSGSTTPTRSGTTCC